MAELHLATFSLPGVSQNYGVKKSTWGQCPQVLASTARNVARSTNFYPYAPPSFAHSLCVSPDTPGLTESPAFDHFGDDSGPGVSVRRLHIGSCVWSTAAQVVYSAVCPSFWTMVFHLFLCFPTDLVHGWALTRIAKKGVLANQPHSLHFHILASAISAFPVECDE